MKPKKPGFAEKVLATAAVGTAVFTPGCGEMGERVAPSFSKYTVQFDNPDPQKSNVATIYINSDSTGKPELGTWISRNESPATYDLLATEPVGYDKGVKYNYNVAAEIAEKALAEFKAGRIVRENGNSSETDNTTDGKKFYWKEPKVDSPGLLIQRLEEPMALKATQTMFAPVTKGFSR